MIKRIVVREVEGIVGRGYRNYEGQRGGLDARCVVGRETGGQVADGREDRVRGA